MRIAVNDDQQVSVDSAREITWLDNHKPAFIRFRHPDSLSGGDDYLDPRPHNIVFPDHEECILSDSPSE